DLLGRLCADAEPVLRAGRVDLDERGLLGRVVLADLFDHAAVALGARVGDDDAVVRGADLTEPLEADLDSHNSPETCWCGRTATVCVGAHSAESSKGGSVAPD